MNDTGARFNAAPDLLEIQGGDVCDVGAEDELCVGEMAFRHFLGEGVIGLEKHPASPPPPGLGDALGVPRSYIDHDDRVDFSQKCLDRKGRDDAPVDKDVALRRTCRRKKERQGDGRPSERARGSGIKEDITASRHVERADDEGDAKSSNRRFSTCFSIKRSNVGFAF